MRKKLIRLDCEKAVYRPLFTLANTLLLIISCVMATKFQGKKHAGTIIQVERKGKHCFYACRRPVIRKRAINVFISHFMAKFLPLIFTHY